MFGEGVFGLLTGIAVVLLLVLLNAFFVAAEFAIVKVRMTQIEMLLRRRRPMARLVKKILDRLDSYLSSAQLGITLVSVGLGWVGKPAIEVYLRPPLERAGLSPEAIATVSFAIAFSLITFLEVVIGEQVPKVLAIEKAEFIAMAIAAPLAVFHRIALPFTWVLTAAARVLLRLFGIRDMPGRDLGYTEEELRLVLSRTTEKEMTPFARSLALRALELHRRPVREIIIPRTQIVFLSMGKTLEENLKTARESGFTRFPICEESLDQTLGMVHIKDLLWKLHGSTTTLDLVSIKRDIIFIPETLPIEAVLSRFLRSRCHMAFVLDEYGGTVGMVTLEDVLEELVGEIRDEFDQEVPPIVRQPGPGEEYLAEGTVPLYQLNALLGASLRGGGVETLSGYLIKVLGRLPSPGEEVREENLHFVIRKVGKRRILQVLVRRMPEPEEGKR